MSYKWIAKSGCCGLQDVIPLIHEVDDSETLYIAMYTDSFSSGYFGQDSADRIVNDHLLEVRIFNKKRELLITRGSIGTDFYWRVTEDDSLGENEYIISEQFIDINEKIESKVLENGNRSLISTVGGNYSLPITEGQKKVMVKSYIDYDQNGTAKVVDARICCFTE